MKLIELGKNFKTETPKISQGCLPFKLVWVNPGEYFLGVPSHQWKYFYGKDDIFQFQTKISKGFWIGQYPVTIAHWKAYENETKEWLPLNKLNYPIYGINWIEAMQFCHKCNDELREVIPEGYHFSLPTELHWEYACNFNNKSNYKLGEGKHEFLAEYLTSLEEPFEVGRSEPNLLGIYDMLGNIGEWCFDSTDDYPAYPVPDWVGNLGLGFDVEYGPQGEFISTWRYRSIRGSTNVPYFREFGTHRVGSMFSQVTNNTTPFRLGFRICLRPITKWDINDPIVPFK